MAELTSKNAYAAAASVFDLGTTVTTLLGAYARAVSGA
jgi:hypothetical protein